MNTRSPHINRLRPLYLTFILAVFCSQGCSAAEEETSENDLRSLSVAKVTEAYHGKTIRIRQGQALMVELPTYGQAVWRLNDNLGWVSSDYVRPTGENNDEGTQTFWYLNTGVLDPSVTYRIGGNLHRPSGESDETPFELTVRISASPGMARAKEGESCGVAAQCEGALICGQAANAPRGVGNCGTRREGEYLAPFPTR